MALNKRKVLDAARKHAQKGAKAKALKEYNRLLQADPRDAKLLLEVGDAYRRWGQAEEAIAQYGKVAQQYRQDGFDARAVAVYKQILNLDPKHYAAYVSLSELYQRMGLDAEAISALQTAADGYHKEGRKTEALELLRQTAALDPTNTTSRLKVAELLRQEGMESEALSEYKAVAEELENQQDRDQLIAVQQRILELKPDEVDTLSSLVRNLMSAGDLARAESFAIRAVEAQAEPPQYELLIALYAQAGNDAKLTETTRTLARLYRDRGDEERARELMQRLPAEEVASQSQLTVDVSDVAEPELGDHELLDDEPFLALSDDEELSAPSIDDDLSLELDEDAAPKPPAAARPVPAAKAAPLTTPAPAAKAAPLTTPAPAAKAAPAAPTAAEPEVLPEGDPDQLLAEANVYLRYGKRDQAITSLRGVIAQEPNHRAALEKLGEAYAAGDEKGLAVEAWTRAAEQVRAAGDADALAVLKDRIAALDPAAAEQIGSLDAASAAAPDDGLDLDVELDLDDAMHEVASDDSAPELDLDSDGDEFEIEIDDEGIDFGSSDEESAEDAMPDLDVDVSSSLDLDLGSNDGADASADAGASATSSIEEELEEAEFYLAQEMYDEAERILERVLERVPNHPNAMLRMGEIANARGGPAQADITEESASIPDLETTERLDDAAGSDLDLDIGLDTEDEFEVDVDLGDDAAVDATEVEAPPPPIASDDVTLPEEPEDDTLSSVEAEKPTASSVAPAEAAPATPGDSFDLREALADVLGDDQDTPSENDTSGVLSTVEDGFGSIFSDFKKGVSETLDEGDYETRYDLGIAYREMGLFEDAIGEFRVCLDSPTRRFDSLYLMGICARQLGRFGDSVNHLEQALSLPEIPTERLAGVYFDLSLAQEGAGDLERACASCRQVIELEPGFPGAADRLAALESGTTTPKLANPDGDFESFDELFADDEGDEDGDAEMVEAVPAEAFESFDDIIEEAEAIDDCDEADTLPQASSAEPEPDPNEDSKATTKSRRKKISFL